MSRAPKAAGGRAPETLRRKTPQQDSSQTYRVSADIGGTFTDIVAAAPDGRCLTRKVLSTPDNYARGVVEGLSDLMKDSQLGPTAIGAIVHGTTVASNAILENRGAKTGLITTKGFRDVLELRRLRIPQLYSIAYKPPRPIVERNLRLEVDERIGPDGSILRSLDEASVTSAVDRLKSEGVEAVAVCLLHSYRNPVHELRVGEIVRGLMPHVQVSLSVDVVPEIREYERTSTTVINAFVGPTVRDYLDALTRGLQAAGFDAPLLIMQSNGGIMPAKASLEKGAHLVESGPAAGVIAAQAVGQRAGLGNLITFDMGGTTAKASIIENGQVSRTTEYEVGAGISLSSRLVKGGGHALKLPVIDLAEVGAGGGSIVWIDKGGALKVGTKSAGADPGPACYGRGGKEPTVTDANVVLGYINPTELAGGTLKLRPELAREALANQVAQPLGLTPLRAAYGVFSVVAANMIRAIKAVSTYRGRDPRDFSLLAFGGNGPVHAAAIANELGIGNVIVPTAPGLFSAVGLLEAQTEYHLSRTFISRTSELDLTSLLATAADLRQRAELLLDQDGSANGSVSLHWLADMRYVGQGYELPVAITALPKAAADIETLTELFGQEHERTYGHRAHDEPVEFVNLRLIARVDSGKRPTIRAQGKDREPQPDRLAYFGDIHGELSTPVITRSQLDASPRQGPMIIEDYDATTVVPPGSKARIDADSNIRIDVGLEN